MHIFYRLRDVVRSHYQLIVLICLVFSVLVISNLLKTVSSHRTFQSDKLPTPVFSPSPTPFSNWQTYQNNKRGFRLLVPPNWEIEEIIGRAIFTPKQNDLGSLQEITVTILDNPPADQPLTTQKEFENWLNSSEKAAPEKGRLYKLDNLVVAGYQSVTLADTGGLGDQDSNDWSLVTWFRKDKENYYINAKGNRKLGEADIAAYNYLLNSMQFDK